MSKAPAMRNLIAISLGAIAGALSRYYLTLWFAQRFGTNFPGSISGLQGGRKIAIEIGAAML
jgi:hypothetical protein